MWQARTLKAVTVLVIVSIIAGVYATVVFARKTDVSRVQSIIWRNDRSRGLVVRHPLTVKDIDSLSIMVQLSMEVARGWKLSHVEVRQRGAGHDSESLASSLYRDRDFADSPSCQKWRFHPSEHGQYELTVLVTQIDDSVTIETFRELDTSNKAVLVVVN